MNKTSKAYNRATRELDALVRKTRETHHAAVDRYEMAEKEVVKWNAPVSVFDLTATAAQANARAAFQDCKSQTFHDVSAAWDSFDQQAKAIRAELAEAVSEASVLRAADVDEKAVILLNSGLMQSRDYQRMVQDYAQNPAILSILRQAAEKYCNALNDSDNMSSNANEIYAMRHIIETAKTSGERELQAFDRLLTTVSDLAGRTTGGFRRTAQLYQKTALTDWESVSAGLIGNDEGGEDE